MTHVTEDRSDEDVIKEVSVTPVASASHHGFASAHTSLAPIVQEAVIVVIANSDPSVSQSVTKDGIITVVTIAKTTHHCFSAEATHHSLSITTHSSLAITVVVTDNWDRVTNYWDRSWCDGVCVRWSMTVARCFVTVRR